MTQTSQRAEDNSENKILHPAFLSGSRALPVGLGFARSRQTLILEKRISPSERSVT